MDRCGRVWTPVESELLRSGLCGRLWTSVDGACRSTDQKVGDSSSSGRATGGILAKQGVDGLVVRPGILGDSRVWKDESYGTRDHVGKTDHTAVYERG